MAERDDRRRGEGGERGALPMFRGISRLALDAKGRLAIPARNRDGLGQRQRAHRHHCRSQPLPARLSARRMGADPGAPDVAVVVQRTIRALQRLLVGHADDVDIDAAGPRPGAAGAARIRVAREGRRAGGAGSAARAVGRGGMGRADARAIAFRRRAAAGARRLLACDRCARSRPRRRSHRRARDPRRRRLRRRDVRPRRSLARASSPHCRRGDASSRSTAIPMPSARRARSTIRVSFFAARGSPKCPLCSTSSRPPAVDGVLLDLGVSSPQIDDAARGFSFRIDGPLDMRMDPTRGESAAQFIARASVRELTEVIRDYGEERFAQSIARAIVAARALAAHRHDPAAGRGRRASHRRAHAG